jgi:aminoglycoside 3-N-acetyltransferase
MTPPPSLTPRRLLGRVHGAIAWRMNSVRFRVSRALSRAGRCLVRLDGAGILGSLGSFGSLAGRSLFVHSSLSACGHVKGGTEAVIRALCEWVGDGTLVLPTHTYCYPGADGNVPVFRVAETPSQVGVITERFRQLPGVVRSNHPSHSLACLGPNAQALAAGHERCNTPCGAGTPYEKLVRSDCAVLMFGARLDAYTLFHTTEDAAGVPYLYYPEPFDLKIVGPEGAVLRVPTWRQDARVPRRFIRMDEWLEARGLLSRKRLGMGELLFVPHARSVHEAVVEALRENPFFLVAEAARPELARRYGLAAAV